MSEFFKSTVVRGTQNIPVGGYVCRVVRSLFSVESNTVNLFGSALGKSVSIRNVKALNTGDIVKIFADGLISRLWNIKSYQNCLFTTSACNFRCLMCPQPPQADNGVCHEDNLKILKLLPRNSIEMICITGGEPFLFPKRVIEYFTIINERFPKARVEILTNGSILSDFDKAKKVALAAPVETCYCISLHGDTPQLAESIMRTPNGWDKAIAAIINLAKLQQLIEIRIVLTKNIIPYIEDIAIFIFRNFPYVSHIALMGQEIIGEAEKNLEDIWVEPLSYRVTLNSAVKYLKAMGMNVSIYNIPLCLLEKDVWDVARQSISTWKNGYNSECEGCKKKNECCGFFTTSGCHIPKGVKSI